MSRAPDDYAVRIELLRTRAALERMELGEHMSNLTARSALARGIATGLLSRASTMREVVGRISGGTGIGARLARAAAVPVFAAIARGAARSRAVRYAVLAAAAAGAAWWIWQRQDASATYEPESDEYEPPAFDDPDPSLP